jgi:hypothetical protein
MLRRVQLSHTLLKRYCVHVLLQVQRAKAAYLARLRARGITVDPFERAHRQEQQLQLQQQQQRTAAALGQAGQAQLQALPAPAAAAAAGVTGALVPAAAGSPAAGEALILVHATRYNLPCCLEYQGMVYRCLRCGLVDE